MSDCEGKSTEEKEELVLNEPVLMSECEDERVKRLNPDSKTLNEETNALGLFVYFSAKKGLCFCFMYLYVK